MAPLFGNISQFTNTQDYLPIVSGALAVDLTVIFLIEKGIIKSTHLKQWYKTCGITAIMANITIISLIIIFTRFIYSYIFSSYSLLLFILLVVIVELVHDSLFYIFFSTIPRGFNKILDIFKDYAKENGYHIYIANATVCIISVLYAASLASLSPNANIIHFLCMLYFVPYTLYTL
jgi:hypothetical protein